MRHELGGSQQQATHPIDRRYEGIGSGAQKGMCPTKFRKGQGCVFRLILLSGAVTVINIAAMGIPNTSMPAFREQLKPEDLAAVATYVVSLNGRAADEGSSSEKSRPTGRGGGGPKAILRRAADGRVRFVS